MAWQLTVDDSFVSGDTSAGGAGSTTGVPTTPTVGAANGWTDIFGGRWSIGSDMLVGLPSGSPVRQLLRLTSGEEGNPDSRVVAYIDAFQVNNVAICLRCVDQNNFYLAEFNFANIWIYSVVSGSPSLLATTAYSVVGDAYTLDFQAVGSGPTTLNLILTDTSTSTIVGNISTTDSTSALQASSLPMGLGVWPSTTQLYARAQCYNLAPAPPIALTLLIHSQAVQRASYY